MVQATMRNKKEYKVVLFGREPKYVAYNPYKILEQAFQSIHILKLWSLQLVHLPNFYNYAHLQW